MRRHLSVRILTAFDAGALTGRPARRASDHLADCAECRAALQRRRAARVAAVEMTSPAAPDVFDRVEARLDGGDVVLLPVGMPGDGDERRRARRALAVAGAVLFLGVGSGAAAVATGAISLPFLIGGGSTGAAVDRTVGVDVPVTDAGLDLILGPSVGPDLVLDVRAEGEGDRVRVVALEGATTARFVVGSGRLTVGDASDGTLRITVPLGVGVIQIRSGRSVLGVVLEGDVRLRGERPGAAARTTVGTLLERVNGEGER